MEEDFDVWVDSLLKLLVGNTESVVPSEEKNISEDSRSSTSKLRNYDADTKEVVSLSAISFSFSLGCFCSFYLLQYLFINVFTFYIISQCMSLQARMKLGIQLLTLKILAQWQGK